MSMPWTRFIRRTASGSIRTLGSVPAEKLSNTSPASCLSKASAIWLRQELCTHRKATLGLFRPAAEKEQRLPIHWLFRLLYVQTGTVRSNSTPRCSQVKSMAARMARKESHQTGCSHTQKIPRFSYGATGFSIILNFSFTHAINRLLGTLLKQEGYKANLQNGGI